MQLYTMIIMQRDLKRNFKICCKQCRIYNRLYETMYVKPPWVLILSHAHPYLHSQKFPDYEPPTVKHTQSKVFMHYSGVYVSGLDTSEVAAFFCLGGNSVAADSPTHDSNLDLEKHIFT